MEKRKAECPTQKDDIDDGRAAAPNPFITST
jgi:hypothetical protein